MQDLEDLWSQGFIISYDTTSRETEGDDRGACGLALGDLGMLLNPRRAPFFIWETLNGRCSLSCLGRMALDGVCEAVSMGRAHVCVPGCPTSALPPLQWPSVLLSCPQPGPHGSLVPILPHPLTRGPCLSTEALDPAPTPLSGETGCRPSFLRERPYPPGLPVA